MRRENGFTLIELMMAVGLTGLLLSMAVPALDIFVSNARQTGAKGKSGASNECW